MKNNQYMTQLRSAVAIHRLLQLRSVDSVHNLIQLRSGVSIHTLLQLRLLFPDPPCVQLRSKLLAIQ